MTVTPNTKTASAAKKVAAFERRFGQAHLYLAYHAALPVALTPDLLYRLRLNFQQDNYGQPLNIPWIAVSNLLLSNLCDEVGYELYQMNIAIRDELLERLQQDTKFGQQRVKELSNFLLDYIHQELQNNDPDVQIIARSQRWVALAYTHPYKTAYEIASMISKLDLNNKAELLRLEVLLQTLAVPLEKSQSLFSYVRGLAAFARGNFSEATKLLRPLLGSDRQIRIVGVKLPIPKPVQGLVDDAQSYLNYSHANLQGKSFKHQDLSNADFSYADIRGADFTNANLTGANFSHATMGLRLPWITVLIICAVLLSIAAGIGAMLIGNFLQTSLTNPPFKEVIALALTNLSLFIIIGVVISRRGIEATLGAFVLTLVGVLYLVIAALGLTETVGFITAWDWITRLVLAFVGVIAFAIGISSSRVGVLSFDRKWAPLLVGGVACAMVAWEGLALQYLLGQYDPYVVTGIREGVLQTWLENRLNSMDTGEAICATTLAILGGVIGLVLSIAVSMALVKSVNKLLAISIGLAWIPVWLGRIRLGESLPRSGGAIMTVILIAGLGTYVGWRSLMKDPRYSFVNQAAVAFTSKFLRGTNFSGADLTDANLSRATVAYANFSDANLTHVSWFQSRALDVANFTETYLRLESIQELVTTGRGQRKVLNGLSLGGINLSGANLSDTSLIGTDLHNANLQDADLSRSNLSQTQLDQADLTGVCLTGGIIQGWKITNSTKLDGIDCDYIYTRLPTPDDPDSGRLPEDKQCMFKPGDFTDLVQRSVE